MTSGQLSPGWKPDPEVPNQQRYWDGTAWTEHVAPVDPLQSAQQEQAAPAGTGAGSHDDGASTPPGWYPDPETPGLERQWDGSAWTSATRAGGAATQLTQVQTHVIREEKSVGLAIFFNFLWPGAGQLYGGVNKNLGITFMLIEGANVILSIFFTLFLIIGGCIGFVIYVGLFIWSSIDVNAALKQKNSGYIGY